MKQRIIKALSLVLALITLLSVLLLPASAAYVAPIINPMLDTYVVDDLITMKYNPDNYPLDPSADHLQIIHFLEYAYSVTDLRYYGLYIYLYNPCGKEIALEGSYLQMSYGSGSSDYLKYPVSVVSCSVDNDDKFVFYKLKVNGIGSVGKNINPVKRVYNLASLEVLYKGESEAVTKSWMPNAQGTRKNVWTYTGYQQNFGSKTGTLGYDVDELDTIPVEMHDASWYSDTSSLGEDYRWEVKSYYFNIPISYILQYGNLTVANSNDTDGLYSVQGEYYKYGVNGLIVPTTDLYDRFLPTTQVARALDGYTISYLPGFAGNFDSYISTDHSTPSGGQYYTQYTSDFAFNIKKGTYYYSNSSNIDYKSLVNLLLTKLNLVSLGSSPYLSNDAFTLLWEASGRPILSNSSYLYMGSHLTNIGERVPFDVSIKDGDLASSIETYASTKKDGFGKWLDKLFNRKMYTDEDGYLNCLPLVQVNDVDIMDIKQEEYIGKDLYLDYDSYLGLKEFYEDMSPKLSNGYQANNVYLMRLGVEPYYEIEVDLLSSPSSFEEIGTGYYYEKVIHKDTDIFNFTFQRSDGSFVTVPVDCDPVDNLGSVVSGSNKDDSNPNNYPKDDSVAELLDDTFGKVFEFIQSLKGAVILAGITLGTVVIATLIIVFWKYLEPLFQRVGKLLGAVGRGLGAFFGGLFRVIGIIFKILLYPLIFIWNVAVMILSIWFPFVSILRIDMSFGGKSSGSDDSKYYYEDRKYKQAEENRKEAEERRKQERHEAELRELERRSRSNSNSSKDDHKPSYGDADEFLQAALKRTEEELK